MTEDQHAQQDPTQQYHQPDQQPEQEMEHPGLESEMQSAPDYGVDTYRGSGRALLPGYLEAHLTVLRSLVSPLGQREVLVDRLSDLEISTLVIWGACGRVFPKSQAIEAASHLQDGSLALIPDCGHMPHVECPDRFMDALDNFLARRRQRL